MYAIHNKFLFRHIIFIISHEGPHENPVNFSLASTNAFCRMHLLNIIIWFIIINLQFCDVEKLFLLSYEHWPISLSIVGLHNMGHLTFIIGFLNNGCKGLTVHFQKTLYSVGVSVTPSC